MKPLVIELKQCPSCNTFNDPELTTNCSNCSYDLAHVKTQTKPIGYQDFDKVQCARRVKTSRKDFLSSVGGLVIIVAILLGIGFVSYFFITGGARIAVVVLPWLNVTFTICLFIFGLFLMPLAYFKRTKAFAGNGMVIASYVFGLTLWLWGFLLTYLIWGATAIIIGLFIAGVGVVPIAMLATLINADWSTLIQLLILTALTFGVRFWGAYLMEKAEEVAFEKGVEEVRTEYQQEDEDYEENEDQNSAEVL